MKTQIKINVDKIGKFLSYFFEDKELNEDILLSLYSKNILIQLYRSERLKNSYCDIERIIEKFDHSNLNLNNNENKDNFIENIFECLFYFLFSYLPYERASIDFIECKQSYNDSFFLMELFFVGNQKSYKKYLQKIYHAMPYYGRDLFEFDDKLKPEDCFYGFLNLKKCEHCRKLIINKKYDNRIKEIQNKIENFIKTNKTK